MDRCRHPMADHYAYHIQNSSPLQNFLNHYCAVRSVVVPGPNASLISRAASAAFRPSLN